MGFKVANWTQVPNALLDNLYSFGHAELLVVLVIVRKTMGYHKKSDPISFSQIMEATGLTRVSVKAGIDAAIAHNFIRIVGNGKNGVNIYELVVDDETNEYSQYTSDKYTGTATVLQGGIADVLQGGTATVHTKEKEKKDKIKHSVAIAPDARGDALSSDTIPPMTTEDNSSSQEKSADSVALPSPPKEKSCAKKEKPPAPPRERDNVFDAVAEHIYDIDASQMNAEGGRIAMISNWLKGKTDGAKGRKVGFISAPATPENVKRFAQDYRNEHPNISIPRDLVKFVEAWRAWATKLNRQRLRIIPAQTEPELTPEQEAERRRELLEAIRNTPNPFTGMKRSAS